MNISTTNNCSNALALMKMMLMLFTMQNILKSMEDERKKVKGVSRRWWVRPTFRDRKKYANNLHFIDIFNKIEFF